MIDKAAAVQSARRFGIARGAGDWGEVSICVTEGHIQEKDVWVVEVRELPPNGDDAWMEIDWQPMRYFVNMETGRLEGFATERSTTMFPDDRRG